MIFARENIFGFKILFHSYSNIGTSTSVKESFGITRAMIFEMASLSTFLDPFMVTVIGTL